MPELSLTDLFREAGNAHHKAFEQANGEDPEWPSWYADFLHERIVSLIHKRLTKSELIYFFVLADRTFNKEKATSDWPEFYAELINRTFE